MSGNYAKLDTSEHTSCHEGSSGALSGPSTEAEASGKGIVTVYVMFKERKLTVNVPSLSSSLLEFKMAIERASEVPVAQQRLVRAGKMLKDLQSSLSELEVIEGCTVHLFPIPQAVARPVNSGGVRTASQAQNVTGVATTSNTSDEHVPGALLPHHVESPQFRIVRGEEPHLNPWFQNTCREVQMWSMILMVLSFFTLFNNLNIFMATGEYGDTPLDKCVFILDTMVSAGGLYVSRVGMVASRTLSREDVSKYCLNLGLLTLAAIIMRLLWAFDIVAEIKKATHKSEDAATSKDPNRSGSGDGSASDPDEPPLTDDMVTTVSMQAAIIAMIIICAWAQCFARAVRLRFALHAYDRVNNASDDADLGDLEAIIVNPVHGANSSTSSSRGSNGLVVVSAVPEPAPAGAANV